jgi:hypothetical protein
LNQSREIGSSGGIKGQPGGIIMSKGNTKRREKSINVVGSQSMMSQK